MRHHMSMPVSMSSRQLLAGTAEVYLLDSPSRSRHQSLHIRRGDH